MAKPSYQDVIDIINESGAHYMYAERGGKHVKLHFQYKGKERFYTTAVSPSDWRMLENVKSDIRRMIHSIDEAVPNFVDQDIEEEEEEKKPFDHLPFPERLRAERELRGWSREKLAETSGLNEELVKHLEIAPEPHSVPYDEALKLSTALGLSLSYLVGDVALEGVPNMTQLAERVRERRTQLNLTLGMLAEKTGIPNQQLANLEVGTYPDFNRMEDLAKGLECSPEWLRSGDKEQEPLPVPLGLVEAIKTPFEFGQFIAFRRRTLGYSQQEFAKKIGITFASEVSKAERGLNIQPLLKRLESVSEVLELPKPKLVEITGQLNTKERGTKPSLEAPHAGPHAHAPTPDVADIKALISDEAEKTRALLVQQHQELMEALKGANAVAALHNLIDLIFKK